MKTIKIIDAIIRFFKLKKIKLAVALIASASFVWLVILFGVAISRPNGLEVAVDGVVLGVIEASNAADLAEYIELHIKSRIQNDIGGIIHINSEITANLGRFSPQNKVSFDFMMNQIINNLDYYIYGVLVFVNNIPLLSFASEKLAQEFLDYLIAKHVTEYTTSYSFAYNIRLEESIISPNNLHTFSTAYSFIMQGHYRIFSYTVRPGDGLGIIAERLNIGLSALLAENPNLTAESIIIIGQNLNFRRRMPLISIHTTELRDGEQIHLLNGLQIWD